MTARTETDIVENLPEASRPKISGVVVVYSEAKVRGARALTEAVVVGRDHDAELSLDDTKISRRHAVFESSPGGATVSDLGSHNGTFVDGTRIESPRSIGFGSVVRVGRTLLLVVPDIQRFSRFPPVEPRAPELLGGPSIDVVLDRIEAFAHSDVPVLLQGDTGTGKDCLARALHRMSGRSGELVPLNCAAIPRELVEAELFGHIRGAFSGSQSARDGLFVRAHGGTLFLDEIGELELETQAKLLRAIEDREIRAIGRDQAQAIDVRVVSASNRSIEEMVARGGFRADLFHRINTARVVLPSLGARREDIPLLAQHFLSGRDLQFRATAMEGLMCHDWVGNVRELRNVVLAAALIVERAELRELTLEHVLAALSERPRTFGADAHVNADRELADVELRARFETALRLRDGNVAQVARDMGIHRARLYEAFHRLNIDASAHRKRK